jgi:hypothetical protein
MKNTLYGFLLLLINLQPSLSADDLITELVVNKNSLRVRVHEDFKKKYLTGDFFVEYEADLLLDQFDYSVLSMPFVMNVISIVWISGETFWVEEMDLELCESLERVKKVFKTMYPKTSWNGELKARKLVTHTRQFPEDAHKTALLFSGGVDSVSSALAHQDKKQLLITAWGHWDIPLSNKGLWKTRSEKIQEFAESFGNTATFLRSNYTSMLNYQYLSQLSSEIPKWRLGAVEGLGWAGLTAPILLSKGISTLHIASSHTWRYPYPSAASPFIDNNLRFCGLKVLHDQFAMTRLQKVAYIDTVYTQLGKEKPFLKICSCEKSHDRNCEECRKCLTTTLCFDALGIDPRPYGLSSSHSISRKILDLFQDSKLNYYTILLGKEIQKMIVTRLREGATLEFYLKKLLAIDFDSKVAFDVARQTKLCWPRMIGLLPQDNRLEIPQGILS